MILPVFSKRQKR